VPATYPLLAGAEKAHMIFNIVFFIALTSVIIQGTSLPLVAKWLRLTIPTELKKRTQSDHLLTEGIKSLLTQVTIPDDGGRGGQTNYSVATAKNNADFIYPARPGLYCPRRFHSDRKKGYTFYFVGKQSSTRFGFYLFET
jgi:hypothetical protein